MIAMHGVRAIVIGDDAGCPRLWTCGAIQARRVDDATNVDWFEFDTRKSWV